MSDRSRMPVAANTSEGPHSASSHAPDTNDDQTHQTTNDVDIPALARLTACEMREGLRTGAFSRAEIADAFLGHIDRVNPTLNALIRVDRDAWKDAARQIHAASATPEAHALDGIPVTIKDNLWVKDRTTTNGSHLFADFVPSEDALAVARLRDAGAALIGATNTPEFACKGHTANPLHGATRHPRDTTLTPGGSSGGAAAAVAAGLCAIALGTDAGGSTRRPAAHTGLIGFKPSRGAIPHEPGFAEPSYGHSVVGILARSVDDVQLAFQQLRGYDPRDPDSVVCAQFAPEPSSGRRLRLAFSPRLGLQVAVDPDVAAAVAAAVARLADAGHHVEMRDPGWAAAALGGSGAGHIDEADLMPLQAAGLASIHGAAFRRDPSRFDPDIARQIETGLTLSAVAVTDALELRKRLFGVMRSLFKTVDCLITPTTPCVAWPVTSTYPDTIEGKPAGPRGHAAFTPLFNHTYLPACSVPCGTGKGGLPVGMQIVAPQYHDATVLALAAECERLGDGRFRRPYVVLPV